MSKEIKEFKVTCKGCNDVKFYSFVDFENEQMTKTKRASGCLGDSFATAATSFACLPLGCLFAGDSIKNQQLRKLPPEERKKVYCKAIVCAKCYSAALDIETVTHHVK
ncbi:MAG: hypothetical protein KAQ75_02865 [Bacteroidales bacterium]|nr:hypothetical protein [Bacteroidales bacterium]